MPSDKLRTHYKSEPVVIRTGVRQAQAAVCWNHCHVLFEDLDMKDIVFILTGENQPVAEANGVSVPVLIAITEEPCSGRGMTCNTIVRAFLNTQKNLGLPLHLLLSVKSTRVSRSGEGLVSVILATVWVFEGGDIDKHTPLISSVDSGSILITLVTHFIPDLREGQSVELKTSEQTSQVQFLMILMENT